MKRPNKKDYDLNDHFEAIRLARDLIKYIDYLELEKQTNQEQKLHVDLVSCCYLVTDGIVNWGIYKTEDSAKAMVKEFHDTGTKSGKNVFYVKYDLED